MGAKLFLILGNNAPSDPPLKSKSNNFALRVRGGRGSYNWLWLKFIQKPGIGGRRGH